MIKLKRLIYALFFFALFAIEAQAAIVSKLYGVTGDGGTPPETLFELNMSDASTTLVLTLGNGDDGEEIAFNPDDGLLYHASGYSEKILETIHPGTLAITPVTTSGTWPEGIPGLTYAGGGDLLAAHRTAAVGLSNITTAGVYTNIGATDAIYGGLAFIGSTLYAAEQKANVLRTINPATGATLSSVSVTLPGYVVPGVLGLATNPVDDTLWALLKPEDATFFDPGNGLLVTLNPASGGATLIGITDVEGMAGIAFVSGEAYTVTPSVGTPSGSITPSSPQLVISGQTTSFTLTPDPSYIIESVGGTCGGTLDGDIFTTAAVTADCTVVANFEPEPTTILYGVTGDGGFPAETLFRIDTDDASTTLVLTLGNGGDGEEIAFNRDDGLLYHASGPSAPSDPEGQPKILETIDLDSLVVTPVTLSGDTTKEVIGMTYKGSGVLLASHRLGGFSSITTAGVETTIGTNDNDLKGLAFIGPTLYAVGKNEDLLRTIDPATGDTLDSVTITLPGFTVYGAQALTTNPDDNTLWAALRIDDVVRQTAALAVIDPATGIATYKGTFDVPGIAGLAFSFIPCDPCEVTPSVGTGPGTTSPSGVQSVASGATTAFTLIADPNYHADFVDGTCGGSLVGTTFTTAPISTHCTVVAHFTIDTFDLTYTAGPGGSISGDTAQTVDYNSSGTQVIAVPDPHFSFVNWSDGFPSASRTDTSVTADIDVTANFAIDTFTITSSVGTGPGSISPLGEHVFDYGSTPEFTLTPDPNYHVDSIGGTCGGTLADNTYTTDPITEHCTVVANFVIDTHAVMSSVGTGSGSIAPVGEQQIDHGSTTQFTLTPAANYHFDSVGGTCGGTLTDNTYTTGPITADCTVVANFAIDTHTVTSSVGTGSGSITPLGGQPIDHGATTQFSLTPDANYHVDSVSGTCGGTLAENTYTTEPIITDCTVIANFAIDTFELTYTAGPGGSISGDSPQTVEYNGSGSEVIAVPDPNYSFVDWSDGVDTASRTDTSVTADIDVTANFAIDTHTVTSSVGTGSGGIAPSGEQQVDHGTATQFTLTPAANYHFDSVGGTCGGTLTDNTYTTDPITADCTVIANFAIDTHTVTSSVGTGSGSIIPLGEQQVDHGSTTQFTLTPGTGFRIASVGGTCGGSLLDNAFTTATITGDCTVVANFVVLTDLMFKDGFE